MGELRRMREDMDRLFSSFGEPGAALASWREEGMMPAVDVIEKDNDVVLKAELPGLKPEDIQITATDDSITMKGEFKKEEESKEGGFIRRERRSGQFFRTIAMPANIKPDQVKASFKNGLLEIDAPKAEEAKSKEIKVNVES
jgi:HSP20 family protein